VNRHYAKKHADLPLSNPRERSCVKIRDHEKEIELVPFVPFPSVQARSSNWTMQCAARIQGDATEKDHKRRGGNTKPLRDALEQAAKRQLKLEETCKELSSRLTFSRQVVHSLNKEIQEQTEAENQNKLHDEDSDAEEITEVTEMVKYAKELEARCMLLEQRNERLQNVEEENRILLKRNKKYKYMLSN